MHKILLRISGLLLLATVCGCGGGGSADTGAANNTPPSPVTLATISITPTSAAGTLGETVQLAATGTYSDASTGDITSTVTWASSKTTVAMVNAAGTAYFQAASGSANITATASGITSNVSVLTVP